MDNNSQESQTPPQRRRTAKRQRLKEQVTVRIDERLLAAIRSRAEGEKLRVTDAVEEGLWLWLRKERTADLPLRLRFLANILPLRLQRQTLRFWAFCAYKRSDPIQEALRQYIDAALTRYGETMASDYEQMLKRLGSPTDEEVGDPDQSRNIEIHQ
jgi:hypothetical protein